MIAAGVLAVSVALFLGLFLFVRMLGRRVVAVTRPRGTIECRAGDGTVFLPRNALTEAPGEYGLWFGTQFQHHALVGGAVYADDATVERRVIASSTALPPDYFPAHWTGHTFSGPDALGLPWREVMVPLEEGGMAPAWLFPVASGAAPWAIHVQGIRTSRIVTLRAVAAAQRAGFSSLVITYRGAGDGAPASASSLGLTEWVDLRAAIRFARGQGATNIVVVAWSMGAGLALELARRDPALIDQLVLICPATNWRAIVHHAVHKAHLPRFLASAALALLSTPLVSRSAGLAKPIDFDELDWTRAGSVTVPTVVIHSDGDAEIPFRLSEDFARAHPDVVTLVQTHTAPHGWEPNVDPERFNAALTTALQHTQN